MSIPGSCPTGSIRTISTISRWHLLHGGGVLCIGNMLCAHSIGFLVADLVRATPTLRAWFLENAVSLLLFRAIAYLSRIWNFSLRAKAAALG
jgi:hypothetical protein